MANVTRTTTWVDAQVLTASALNGEFNNLLNSLNIVNADIAAGAAIAISKVNTGLSGSIVGTTDTQSLSNKTDLNNKQTLVTATDGATVTFDISTGKLQTVTLGGNRTLALSNVSAGHVFALRLVQDATGSRTVTWFTTIKWVNGTAPTLTTTANKTDVFGFICTSTGNYDGYIIGQNL